MPVLGRASAVGWDVLALKVPHRYQCLCFGRVLLPSSAFLCLFLVNWISLDCLSRQRACCCLLFRILNSLGTVKEGEKL